MKTDETPACFFSSKPLAAPRKSRRFLHHPFTFMVLVWVFLWLMFYAATEFI